MSEWMQQMKNSLSEKKAKLQEIKHQLPPAIVQKFMLLAIVLLALPMSVLLIQRRTELALKAQEQLVRLYFSPSQIPDSSDMFMRVMADAQINQLSFARIVMTFDPTKLSLSQELQTTGLLKTSVAKTSMQEANNTGRIVIVLGLDPGDRNSPPTALFELAQLTFSSKTTQSNQTTYLNFDNPDMQMVDIQAANLSISGENTSIVLNPSTTGTLTGRVTDMNTNAPVAGASVSVKVAGSKGKSGLVTTATSDASGVYMINLEKGSYDVEANALGYAAVKQSTTITDGTTATLDFALPPKSGGKGPKPR